MSRADALLAYLVSSFPGNTENIATEALRHVFDHSDASIEALNEITRSGVGAIKPIAYIKSQVIHDDGSRPDLVGFDEDGIGRVFIEVKFWAALTANQPNTYLNRLPNAGPSLLVFLTPEDRIESLWPMLRERIYSASYKLEEIDSERKCVRIAGTQKHLMVLSWGSLLDGMAARSLDNGELVVDSEIRQLRSLAQYADEGAFKPIRLDESFNTDSESRLRLYKRLVDAATEQGIAQEWVNRKGLRATPRVYGYGRYIRVHGTVVWFGINTELFEATGETPLWVNCSGNEFAGFQDELRVQNARWAPVELRRGAEFPEILEGVVESLRYIADRILDGREAAI